MNKTENFLAHHGVLGMHWGIRKDEGSDSKSNKVESKPSKDLSREERDALIGSGIAITAGAIAVSSILAYKAHIPLSQLRTEIKDLPSIVNLDKDVIIPKGNSLYRVAGKLENTLDAPKYATYTKEDILKYRKDWSAMSAKNGLDFKSKFTANKDAKIASPKTMRTLAKSFFEEDPKGKKILKEEYGAGTYYAKDESIEAKVEAFLRISSGGTHGESSTSSYLAYLKSKGYSGITDLTDTADASTTATERAHSFVRGAQHAVVLFDQEAFSVTGSNLTAKERKAAEKLFEKAAAYSA